MPLKVVRRSDTGALTISGTVKLPDGTRQRVRARAQSDDLQLAKEEAAALEAKILRDAWHGERRGVRSFAEAVEGYLLAAPRKEADKKRLKRILIALGDVPLSAVNQTALNRVRAKIHADKPISPATVIREVIVPLRAVMHYAHEQEWCDAPRFVVPRRPAGRTLYLLPAEASRLIDAAAPHLKALLIFLLGTGARLSEALELEWRDVDLSGARATFWKTKGNKRRVAALPPVVVAALAGLVDREGPVFRWETRRRIVDGKAKRVQAYADKERQGGGQIKTGWRGAIRRAKLDPALSPHDLRHTWASWHYAINRDLLSLKIEGGWSTVTLVERYAHLLPSGHEAGIRAFWHGGDTRAPRVLLSS